MTTYFIDVHEVVHTCPAWDQLHAVDITRTIVEAIGGGPCRMPHSSAAGTVVPCGDIRPRDKQCVACKVQVIVRHTTVDDRGYEGPGPYQAPLFEANE